MKRIINFLSDLWWVCTIVGFAVVMAVMKVIESDQLEYGEWLNESTLFVWLLIGVTIYVLRERQNQFRS